MRHLFFGICLYKIDYLFFSPTVNICTFGGLEIIGSILTSFQFSRMIKKYKTTKKKLESLEKKN